MKAATRKLVKGVHVGKPRLLQLLHVEKWELKVGLEDTVERWRCKLSKDAGHDDDNDDDSDDDMADDNDDHYDEDNNADNKDYNGDDNDDDAKEQEAAPVSHHCVFTQAECPTTKRVTGHKNTNAAFMPTIIIMVLEHKW